MTTLDYVRKAFAAPEASLGQLRQRFTVASEQERNRVFDLVTSNLLNIEDPAEAFYFIGKHFKASAMHARRQEKQGASSLK